MDLLQEIKNRLSITDDFHNDLLNGFATDTKDYLLSAGVKNEIVESEKSIGVIAKGVADLWNDGKFSEFFYQRAIQLTFEGNHVQT
jgi:hypothetical protein